MKRRLDRNTIQGIRKDFATGKFRQIDLAARYSCSVGTVNHIIHNLIHFDKHYQPPVKRPVDAMWAAKEHKRGKSFDDIARAEALIVKRDKPLSAECIRQKVKSYVHAQKVKSKNR